MLGKITAGAIFATLAYIALLFVLYAFLPIIALIVTGYLAGKLLISNENKLPEKPETKDIIIHDHHVYRRDHKIDPWK